MSKSKEVLKRLSDLVDEAEKNDAEMLMSLIWLVFESESKQHDLYFLAKTLNVNQLEKIIDYYNGGTLRIPSKKEFRECLMTVMALKMKFDGVPWESTKKTLGIKDKESYNSTNILRKMNNVSEDIKQNIYKMFKEKKEISEIAVRLLNNGK